MDEQTRRFPHHRLAAYQFSLEVAAQAKDLSDKVPRGYRTVADQLLRAGTSTVLLIAEGANRYTAGHKRQRFMEARGECGEVAAAAELLTRLGLVPVDDALRLQATADRVAALLTGLIKRHS